MSDPMREIMASFFVECEELHEALVDALQSLADGEGDSETINVAFRAVHSIKGGAGAFGLDALVEFAHRFETVMDLCRSGRLVPDAALLDLFFRCGDTLFDLIRASRDGVPHDSSTTVALAAELTAAAGGPEEEPAVVAVDFQPMTIDLGDFGPAETSPPAKSFRITFRPEPGLYDSGNEPVHLLRALAELGRTSTVTRFDADPSVSSGNRLIFEIDLETDCDEAACAEVFEFVDSLCHLEIASADAGPVTEAAEAAPVPAEPPLVPEPEVASAPRPPSPAPQPDPAAHAAKANPTVRVDLDRIDRLVNLVGELVINQAMLSQSISEHGIPPNSAVATGLDEFLQLTRDIQEGVMMIRAQPVKSLFQRMSRIVREASAAVGKSVRLVATGENTEIDKTAIERLADPLTHMIRNAVDHGLEPTQTRIERGKPAQGVVELSAAHKSGRVVIEIRDDGGGINRAKVRKIAEAKGLVSEDAVLTDPEIDQLLFLPGFSTADEVSNLSGRGVGMDVVRTEITQLGGRITIESTPGVGTVFSISLPLTLAVLDGMVVTVASETLVVPLGSIVETLSLSPAHVRPASPGQFVVRVRNQFVPVMDLGVELGYRDAPVLGAGTIALLLSPDESTLIALLVDTIEDQRQVVIKGLQDSYGHVPGVAAATILGDGQIALILDPADLVHSAIGRNARTLEREAS